MAENNKTMDRRTFVFRNCSFLVGSFLGLNHFSKAFAFVQHNKKPLFQAYMALVIDDIGFSLYRTRQFLKLGVPMTFAILPRLEHSLDLAIEICDDLNG
ncbi:MAG: divergent polysaccharide deacetylase family protein [Desulfatiglandales bacterium]|nr:divergent polysaccharide deacetylase family protein [Desulfatiglandales bacterium]